MLIIFDLDDTLIDTSGCITPVQLERALERMIGAGFDVSDENEALDLLKRLDQTAGSAREALSEFLEIMGGKEEFYSLGEEVIYGDFPSDMTVLPLDDVLESLEELKDLHKLALVTVGRRDLQLKKMEKAGIDSAVFSKIIVSEDRHKKPHYEVIMDELRFMPKETIICGDRVLVDLSPAKELGCKTIHMRSGRGLNHHVNEGVDFAVTKFKHIKDIVAQL